ncbi:MAG: sulfotransferase [Verrucomicrobia bacterium]|nr:sulfotransferase [Verrucomicrobiota bacterium]
MASTIEETRAPLVIRMLNKAGAALDAVGLRSKPLPAAQLIEKAKRHSGLSDFGEPDFFEPLSRLLESCHREARLNVIGKLAVRNDVVRILCNRLHLEDDRRRHPEIAQQEIREPVFIVGLPRSGTTVLHTLLGVDPAHRVPRTWEVMSPSPPDAKDRQRRIRYAERDLSMLRWLAPTFEQVHATGANLPQECVSLMSPTFMSDQFDTMYNIPSYRRWFFRQDFRPAYQFHRQFLQHLQVQQSGERWILKAPAHMFAADALLSIYPDAKFVQLHRDPIEAVASVSSLVTILRRVFSDSVDPVQVGRDAMVYWAEALKTFTRVRDTLPPDRVCDVHYEKVRRDPVAAATRIYEYFGWRLKNEVEDKMREVLSEQTSRTNGTHRYNAAYFQLEGGNGFAEYCERFGFVPSEGIEQEERERVAAVR